MKYRLILKNNFKTFLKSKWIISLLAVIIFLTATTFTMMNSISKNMETAYDKYMQSGKVHDLTIDEQYLSSVEPKISVEQKVDGNIKTFYLKYQPYDPAKDGNIDYNDLYKKFYGENSSITSDSTNITNESDARSYFRQQILSSYSKTKRETYIKDLNEAFKGNISNISVSKSILLSGNEKNYKFVWSQGSFAQQDSNQIDKIVLSEGEEITNQQSVTSSTGAIASCNSENIINATDPWTSTPYKVESWKQCIYNVGKIGDLNFYNLYNLSQDFKIPNTSDDKYIINDKDKGYKVIIKDLETSPLTGGVPYTIVNPIAYEVIVSPSFAKIQNIKPISHKELYGISEDGKPKHFDLFTRQINNWNGLENSRIQINGIDFVVVGIGTTPDYVYPIMGASAPVVNINTQSVVFVSKPGIERVYDIFNGREIENYLVAHANNTSSDFLEKINKFSEKYMIVSGSDFVHSRTSSGANLASIRITTLSTLQLSINQMTWVIVTILYILSAFIVIVVIKRQIYTTRTTLGILQANGFSKVGLAFSFTSISAIITIFPSIIGYVLGFFLQAIVFNNFDYFWTLPSDSPPFSFLSLLLVVIVPMSAIFVIAFLIALWTLRGRIIDNINNNVKTNNFGVSLSKLFWWMDIKSRYALAIFTSNALKMFVIAGATTASVTAGSVSLGTMGKLTSAQKLTKNVHSYNYKIDLKTPTEQGGQYGVVSYQNLNNWVVPTYKDLVQLENVVNKEEYFVADDSAQNNGFYLYNFQNKTWNKQNDSYIPKNDYYIDWKASESWRTTNSPAFQNANKNGFGGSLVVAACGNEALNYCTGINLNEPSAPRNLVNWYGQNHHIQYKGILNQPQEGTALDRNVPPGWTLAENLLPENQKNIFNNSYNEIAKAFNEQIKVELEVFFKTLPIANTEELRLENEQKIKDKEIDLNATYNPNNFTAPGIAYKLGIKPYFVAYNQVGFNPEKEILYSYADGYFGNFSNKQEAQNTDRFSITGLPIDASNLSDFYKVPSNFLLTMKRYEYLTQQATFDLNNPIPIFINIFVKDKYQYDVGDELTFNVSNTLDRYTAEANNQEQNFHTVKLRIEGFIDTYQSSEIITSQEFVNIMLQQGLKPSTDRLVSFNNVKNDGTNKPNSFFNNVDYLFNGVMSNEKEPIALKVLNVYSESGFYPATASLIENWNGKKELQYDVFPEQVSSIATLPSDYIDKAIYYVKNVTTPLEDGFYQYRTSTASWSKATNSEVLNQYPYGYLLSLSGIEDSKKFIDVFSSGPYSALVTSTIDVSEISKLTFENISNFVGVILWTVLVVTLFISVIFTIIMAISIIEDNKKNISTLKVLGYKNTEISSIFSRGYLAPILIGSAIAAPLSILIAFLLRKLIITFGGITAPVEIVGWEVVVSFVVVVLAFSILFISTTKALKSHSALQALN